MRPVILEPFAALYHRLSEISNWDRETLQECINAVSAEYDINMGKIAQPLRVAVTGTGMSPAIDVTLALLGKSRVLQRMEHALVLIRERASASN